MGDFSNYGGSEEENAEIKRLNAEIVSYRPWVETDPIRSSPVRYGSC